MVGINVADSTQISPQPVSHLIKESFAASFAAFPFVAFAGVLIALPVALWLRRLGVKSLPAWLLIGLLSGGVVGAAVFTGQLFPFTYAVIIGALPGLAAAATWWTLTQRDLAGESSDHA